jgi:ribonuclease III
MSDDLTVQNLAEETPAELVKRLNLPFTDLFVITRALTHRSYLNEHPDAVEDNERLEFLGDAVLNFVVGAWLYQHFPEMPEGDLTRMRSALVDTKQLAINASRFNLGQAMRLGRGEVQGGGRTRPALLCNTFEALIGALYLQAGIEYVQQFMGDLCEQNADAILEGHQNEDPKSNLQEWSQGQGLGTPLYVIKNIAGPEHAKEFEIDVYIDGKLIGSGSGASKQTAEKAAASAALKQLGL